MARSGAGQRAWLPPPRCWSSLLLRVALVVLSSAASARAQSQTGPTVPVGAVGFKPVAIVNPKEFDDTWYFWLIIAVIAAFFVVGGFFVWRGVRQWRLHKRQAAAQAALGAEQAQQGAEGAEGERAPAAPTAPASPPPPPTNGQQRQRDVELGDLAPAGPAEATVAAAPAAAAAPVVSVSAAAEPAVPSEQAAWQRATAALSQNEAWLRERERRTGVHPSRYRW